MTPRYHFPSDQVNLYIQRGHTDSRENDENACCASRQSNQSFAPLDIGIENGIGLHCRVNGIHAKLTMTRIPILAGSMIGGVA